MTATTVSTATTVVLGATGRLGRAVIAALLAREARPASITAAGRNTEALNNLAAQGVATARVDYDDEAGLQAALHPGATVLLISGSDIAHRRAQHQRVIDAAVRAGVDRLVYTSVLRAGESELFVAPDHRAAEEALAASGLDTTILRNGWYTENYAPAVVEAATTGVLTDSTGSGRIASATRADYAEAAAVVLATDSHAGRVYELGGASWDYDDLAAVATRLTGRRVRREALTHDEHVARLTAAGLAEIIPFTAGLDDAVSRGALDTASTDLADLLGRRPAGLEEGLRGAVATALAAAGQEA